MVASGAVVVWGTPPILAHVDAPVSPVRTVADTVERARALAATAEPGRRRLLGITGAPGAGKSTLAAQLVDALGPEVAVVAPMDGFHLASTTLVAWGRAERKGAPDTFDAGGYAALLARLRTATDVVHAPRFDRHLEESIGSAIPVPPEVPLVVTEGNYLLLGEEHGPHWAAARAALDEVWFVEVEEGLRLERLVARHVEHGRARDEAEAWARGTDQRNAELVARGRRLADLVVRLAPTPQ